MIGKQLGCFLSNEDLIEVKCCYHFKYLLCSLMLLCPYAFVGGSLSVLLVKQIRELMQDFSSKHIIPYMEQKIRALNQQVLYFGFLLSSSVQRSHASPYDNFCWFYIFYSIIFAFYFSLIRCLLQGKVSEIRLKTYGGERGKMTQLILQVAQRRFLICLLSWPCFTPWYS